MQRSDFRHFLMLPVRWGDMDTLGHVNNVQYLRYLESGRVAYFEEILQAKLEATENVILADIQCAFRQQLHYPTIIEVATRVNRMGSSSMQLRCAIYRQGEEAPVATSIGVVVWFGYAEQRPKAIPEPVRRAIMDFETIPPEG